MWPTAKAVGRKRIEAMFKAPAGGIITTDQAEMFCRHDVAATFICPAMPMAFAVGLEFLHFPHGAWGGSSVRELKIGNL
jgi:hypothetical protein